MVAARGQVPKRAEERRRRNTENGIAEQVTVDGPTVSQPALRPGLHPLAVSWYNSLAKSGQSRFYEPSDWLVAQIVAEAIEEFAETRRAGLLDTILAGASLLLATEGDRRRMRLELSRTTTDADEEASVSALERYRDRIGA